MKVLIVDDEKHVRHTIRYLVEWERLGVDDILEAENGNKAIEYIREENPPLVITDMMMPVTNGVQLMEWMGKHAPDSKVIVISGYNDFELLRHTIRYGGSDYLLKPIVPKQLQEAVDKAVQSWKEEEQERRRKRTDEDEIHSLRQLYRNRLLTKLVKEPLFDARRVEQATAEIPELSSVSSCQVAVISYPNLGAAYLDSGEENSSWNSTLLSVCNKYLQPGEGLCFRNMNDDHEIVLLLWTPAEQAHRTVQRLSLAIQQRAGQQFNIGVGLEGSFPQSAGESYRQANYALRRRDLLNPTGRVHIYHNGPTARVNPLRFGEYEENISLAMNSGSEEHLLKVLEEWLSAVEEMETISMEQWETFIEEYKFLKSRWIKGIVTQEQESGKENWRHETLLNMPLDSSGYFSLALFKDQVSADLLDFMHRLTTFKAQGSRSMSDIAVYIENNYFRDITLKGISQQFHLNREYISRKFKQEMNENVIDFLNRIRIEKAKVLLLNRYSKITEVANQVGYQDEKYFSRVFKKITGQSPKTFRDQVKDSIS